MSEEIIEVGIQSAELENNTQEKDEEAKRSLEIEKMYAPRASNIRTPLFFLSVTIVLILGSQSDLENYITAESGLGYALGVTGGLMMLIMLLYSVRKRFRWFHHLGATRYWFKAHMVLGVIGPIFILFHANFQFGSTNSNVALVCMLLVAGSGLVGRYIYGKIHYGLYGGHATLKQLQIDTGISQHEMDRVFTIVPTLRDRIQKIEEVAFTRVDGILHGLIRMLELNVKTRYTHYQSKRILKRACKIIARRDGWSRVKYKDILRESNKYLTIHFETVRKIAGFTLYERLFSLWHVLHLPLFIMLILSGTVHVLAVHMF